MQTTTTTPVDSSIQSSLSQSRRVIAAATLAFGVGLVFLTGFAHSETVHNAAHDARHALAFPCH